MLSHPSFLKLEKMDFNKWIKKLLHTGVKLLKGAADISYFSFPYKLHSSSIITF